MRCATQLGVIDFGAKDWYKDVNINMIANGLSKICRFAGQCDNFYSVAEHCRHMATYLNPIFGRDVARLALLHDSMEAFSGDIVNDFKTSLHRDWEENALVSIYKHFGLKYNDTDEMIVKRADEMILRTEFKALFRYVPEGVHPVSLGVQIQCWDWKEAYEKYIECAENLGL